MADTATTAPASSRAARPILVVTMNCRGPQRPVHEMMRIMEEAWDRVDEDPEIRVAILTGAGGAFCAGMDPQGDEPQCSR